MHPYACGTIAFIHSCCHVGDWGNKNGSRALWWTRQLHFHCCTALIGSGQCLDWYWPNVALHNQINNQQVFERRLCSWTEPACTHVSSSSSSTNNNDNDNRNNDNNGRSGNNSNNNNACPRNRVKIDSKACIPRGCSQAGPGGRPASA